MQQPEPTPVPPDPIASASSGSPWIPYSTTKHRVTKGRYITSNDPRGYIPVYEYPLNNQWVMMDVDDGYVLWTGIWKALGNAKADIVKMIESQPELESQLRRVRGGYLKIQGTWMPYEVALRLARRVAWPIRHDLVPLFGPTFPSTCLSPDQPGYGQVLDNAGRRRKRGPNAAARAAAAALRNQQHLHGSLTQIPHRGQYSDYGHHYPPPSAYYNYPGAPPDEYGGYPPRGHSPYAYDAPPAPYGPPGYPAPPGDVYGYPPPAPYSGPPGRGYPPGPPPPSDYTFPPLRNDVVGSSTVGFSRRGPSDSRTRYTPYPVPISPTQPHTYPPAPGGVGGYHSSGGGPSSSTGPLDLPPISTIALGPSVQRDSSGPPGSAGVATVRPMLERSLPPIESMSREGAGMPPSMDTAAVLRRLRLEDGSTHSPTSNGAGSEMSPQGDTPSRSALTPLGIARRESGGPSEQYLQTRRRSASAPPPALSQALGGVAAPFSTPGTRDRDYDRSSDRERGVYGRRSEMARPGEYPPSPPSRYGHAYSRSGSEQYPPPGSAGPTRNIHHQRHERHHHPYANGSTSRSSISSSHWTKQHSPSFDRDAVTGPDEPVSPASSAPPNPYAQSMYAHYQQTRSPPHSPTSYHSHHHGVERFPSSRAGFVGITRHLNGDRFEEMDEDEVAAPRAPHSSSFVRGEVPRSPSLRRGSDEGFDDHRRSSAMRHYDTNASNRAGDTGGSGLDALARAAASASASQASMSPPRKPSPPVDTTSLRRLSDSGERDGHSDERTHVPVRPW